MAKDNKSQLEDKKAADENQKPADGKDSQASKAAKKKDVSPSASSPAVFNNFEIFPDSPFPHYDSAENKAYRARKTNKGSEESLFAIVCKKELLPRRQAASVYSGIINPSLASLVSYGKVYWPPAKQERFVVIYKDNLGRPIVEAGAKTTMGWKQEHVVDVVLTPLISVFQDFRDKDFFHGAIRPSNMFDGGKNPMKKVILGDCLSTPAAYSQPSLFETIERAMANPIARGRGTLPDDLYALGVSIAVMMRTQDPLEGMSEDDIIREKIKNGSYAAITGKDRFRGSILELLRGLLHDDPTQRWTIDEVLVWMDGRRLSPKQAVKKKKAARPFTFGGEKFLQAPLLAMAFDNSPSELLKVVEDESLEQWLDRSLEDEEAFEYTQQAILASSEGGKGPGYERRLVANISSALDTMAPIRYSGLRMMGDGIGSALYRAVVLKNDVRGFKELFLNGVAMNWATVTENPNLDIGGLISKFDECRNYLRLNKLGYGVERCLYALVPDAPCLSPKFESHYVTSPEDMMYAFEDLCEQGQAPAFFMDRHTVAYLYINDPKSVDSYLYDLNSAEEYKKIIGDLKCLAAIQRRSKMPKFPFIAETFFDSLSCVFKRFHDLKLREKVRAEVEKASKLGDLSKMVAEIDNPTVAQKDFRGFQEAMAEYADLKDEYEKLDRNLEDNKSFGKSSGREFSALVSSVLSVLVIAVISYMFLSQ